MSFESRELTRRAADRGIAARQTINGIDTHYWYYPAAKSAQPAKGSLVMIHGYRGNHLGLSAIVGALEDFDVYVPDLPGFGKSEAFHAQHTIENYSLWLASFIGGLKSDEKPLLLGHSFGSIVVSHHAANFRDFSALILENPVSAPALDGPKALLTLLTKSFFKLAELSPEKTGERLLKSWPMVRGMSIVMTKSRNRLLRRWVHRQHDENFNDFANRRVAIEGYRASISNCVSDFAAKFNTRVLIIAGEKDDITTVSQQQEMARLIKTQHRLHVIPGVGHLTHYECPAAVANLIRQFVIEQAKP